VILFKSIILSLFLITNFNASSEEGNVGSYQTLSVEDAEKILGQAAKLIEQNTEEKDGLVRHTCTFQANAKDEKTDKLGVLYYLFEKYPGKSEAKKEFASIVESNVHMPGQKLTKDLGNETWIHTDDANFYMIMFRKENKIVRVKINKITSLTNTNELIDVLKKIAVSLN